MAVARIVTRTRTDDGVRVGQLMCHPTLPLVAGLDSDRPAVHVWEHGAGGLRERGTIGAGSAAYADTPGAWRRRAPGAAWHPGQPLLLVASEGAVVRWTPEGLSVMGMLPPAADYRHLAFSPDGRTLWAWPSAGAMEDEWTPCSDAIDLASGSARTARSWDTGVTVHPGGGLAATLRSNQGATLGLFARVDQDSTPAVMRVLRRALILDCDGYSTPVFSPDGRHFAIRGSAGGQFLLVFEFPSLSRVLATAFGDPNPGGYPPPREWLEQMWSWSKHNIAFGARPGVLWVGTPGGVLAEIQLGNRRAVEHDVLDGSGVAALCATAGGDLIAATSDGDLALISVPAGSATTRAADSRTAQAQVAAFLHGSSEAPDDGSLRAHLVLTNGAQTWEPDDLETVSTATESDPGWLRIRAAVNRVRAQDT
jgi:hypothetical protein